MGTSNSEVSAHHKHPSRVGPRSRRSGFSPGWAPGRRNKQAVQIRGVPSSCSKWDWSPLVCFLLVDPPGKSMLQVPMERVGKSWYLPEVSGPPCSFCSCWHGFAAFCGIYTINTYAGFQNSLKGLNCKQSCSLIFPASILVALQNLQQAPFSGILSPRHSLLSTHGTPSVPNPFAPWHGKKQRGN